MGQMPPAGLGNFRAGLEEEAIEIVIVAIGPVRVAGQCDEGVQGINKHT